jgi:hypothetical protein
VHRLLAERVAAKKAKNYEEACRLSERFCVHDKWQHWPTVTRAHVPRQADRLRRELVAVGILVDDKERTWRALGTMPPAAAGGGAAGAARHGPRSLSAVGRSLAFGTTHRK